MERALLALDAARKQADANPQAVVAGMVVVFATLVVSAVSWVRNVQVRRVFASNLARNH